MAQLIDSSVLIAMERRGLQIDQIDHISRDPDGFVASITASELLVGVFRSDTAERRENREKFVEDVLRAFTVISFDLEGARRHARLTADLSASGVTIGSHDLIIAATALDLGYSVLTENVRDFDRVPGLVVNRPSWP
jgi:tRNA(fMet)-specific endonuclease VapC